MTKSFSLPFFLLFAFHFLLFSFLFSQDTAKTSVKTISSSAEKKKVSIHSPKKAMIFSAVIPGLGQAYNKKYWKIPIVYATMGSTIYFFDFNNKLYRQYKQAYIYKTDNDPNTIDLYPYYDETQLKEQVAYYRRYRDLSVILTSLFYTLNIVDAYVDAQLKTFDVSDNLSMKIFPSINLTSQKNPALGLTMTLRF
ncbi:MAG: hypothetical protein HY063_07850 [Bacteroidetes bacterium]|nr:hypothetical protein [Bacteroidota bacterium]